MIKWHVGGESDARKHVWGLIEPWVLWKWLTGMWQSGLPLRRAATLLETWEPPHFPPKSILPLTQPSRIYDFRSFASGAWAWVNPEEVWVHTVWCFLGRLSLGFNLESGSDKTRRSCRLIFFGWDHWLPIMTWRLNYKSSADSLGFFLTSSYNKLIHLY